MKAARSACISKRGSMWTGSSTSTPLRMMTHPYTVAENGNRRVHYANKAELMDGIVKKYHPEALLEGDVAGEGGEMAEPKQTEAKNHQPPKSNRNRSRQPKPLPEQTGKDGKKGGSQPSEKQVIVETEPVPVQQEVSDGQT